MMLLLANENVPRLTVEALRAAGHDTIWARVDMAGSSDEDVVSGLRLKGEFCSRTTRTLATSRSMPVYPRRVGSF